MRRTTVFLFLLLVLAACQRDDEIEMEIRTPIVNPPTNPVTGSLIGVIFDDSPSHSPISGALVTIGSETQTTNQSGEFIFDNIQLYENGTYVTVEKEGYFDGSERFNALKDGIQNIEIQLLQRRELGSIQTSNGGPIDIGEAKLDLPAGNYISQDGTYTGEMNIYAKWLNPTDEAVFSAFPGELTGVNEEARLKALASFGLIVLEVEGTQGQAIQLPESSTALITLPIPEVMREFAPDIIELWSFDQENGTWVEEGEATKEGDTYLAQIDHFSIWSLNLSFDPVILSSQINTNGFPAINKRLKIVDPQSGFITFTNTNSEGRFSVTVPEGKFLNLFIDGDCINTPYSQTIEPQIDSNPLEEPIELSVESDDFTINGTVVDCNGAGVSQAWVRVDYENDNELIRTGIDGSFSIDQSRCISEPFSVYAINPNGTQSMISLPQQLQGADNANLEELRSCQPIDFGFAIDYANMDWATQLDETVDFSWTWSSVGSDVSIINIKIKDDQQIYAEGAIRFNGDPCSQGPLEANYLLTFPTAGFSETGECTVTCSESNGVKSFRFTETQVEEPNLTFDLVYFD